MSIFDSVQQVISRIEDEFNSQAESLVGELTQTTGQIEGFSSDIDSHWQQVAARGEAVISQAADAESQVQQLGDELVNRAGDIRDHIDTAIEEGNAFFDSARTVVETLDQGVLDLIPDADDIMATVDETINTLGEQAQTLDAALEATREITDKYLHDPFNALVGDVRDQIYERCSDLGDYVDSDFIPALSDQVSQFQSHIDEVVTTGTDKLEEVRATAETEGSNAMDQVMSMFGDQFGDLINTAETVANAITQVGGAMTSAGQAVGTTTQVMGSAVNTTAVGAKSVIGIIEDIVDIFNSVI